MKTSLKVKLDHMHERFQEIGRLLSESSVISDQDQFKVLSKEYAQLEPVVNCFKKYLAFTVMVL